MKLNMSLVGVVGGKRINAYNCFWRMKKNILFVILIGPKNNILCSLKFCIIL